MRAIIDTFPIGRHQLVMHLLIDSPNRHFTVNHILSDHRYFANCEWKISAFLHDSVMQAMWGYKFYLGKISPIVQF